MSVRLQNEDLIVDIAIEGAELTSIKSKIHALEYLWQADPTYWGRRAPILFPIVGRLKNNVYTYKNVDYPLGQHGFARDFVFKADQKSNTLANFILVSNDLTYKIYPFEFKLTITYELEKSNLKVSYLVENLMNEIMFFSIGAHPGFNVPLTDNTLFEDYKIIFHPNNDRIRIPLSGPYLDLTNKKAEKLDKGISLSRDLFDNDALIYETQSLNTLTIQCDKTERFISLTYEDFPYVGIWSPPKKAAPFVCIEPWLGIADTLDSNGKIEEKLGIISLEAKKSFSAQYSITVG